MGGARDWRSAAVAAPASAMAPADAKKMRRNMIRLLQKRYVNTTAGYEDRAVLQPLLAFMHRVIGRTVTETQRKAGGNAMVLFTRAIDRRGHRRAGLGKRVPNALGTMGDRVIP